MAHDAVPRTEGARAHAGRPSTGAAPGPPRSPCGRRATRAGRTGRTGSTGSTGSTGPTRITPLAAAYPTLTTDGRKTRAADVPSPVGAAGHPGEPVG